MIVFDPQKVDAARCGNRAALDELITSAADPIFNLAMRMLANRQDAEDATQEILIKIVTQLGALRDLNAAGAWAYKIAARHLVNQAKTGRVERMRLNFTEFARDLEQFQQEPSQLELTDAEYNLAVREVKVGCTMAMLVCLSRPLRMSYILGEILELTDAEASEVLDISTGTFRQRLRRARNNISTFMRDTCGLQSKVAPCSCKRRVGPALKCGRVEKGISRIDDNLENTPDPEMLRKDIASLETAQRTLAIMRSNPEFSTSIHRLISDLLANLPSQMTHLQHNSRGDA